MPDDKIKRMDIKEFRETGYLHEVNRKYLHPMGLALEVVVDDKGNESLGGVWDCRDDPEGIMYGADLLSPEKAAAVQAIFEERVPEREARLGFVVQPADMEASVISALLDS